MGPRAIELGFYERGRSRFMTGIEVAPELRLEELFFVAFLPYLAMVLHAAARTAADEPITHASRPRRA